MDPFIEACGLWADFHPHLIEKIYESLADAAPSRYLVRTGERSYLVLVEENGKVSHAFVPDVSVTTPEKPRRSRGTKGKAAVAEAEVEPVTMRAFVEEAHRETFVEIYEATPEQRLVTCIEVLSPSNKQPGTPGWELYLRKRQSLMLGGVHLVEIDLLRGGKPMPMLDPWPECAFRLLLARAHKPQSCRVWPVPLSQRLPPIPVPLAKPDADLILHLQPMVEAIYQRSRYARSIDYRKPLTPALNDAEGAWLRGRLQECGRKSV
jgi:hypothetical protein